MDLFNNTAHKYKLSLPITFFLKLKTATFFFKKGQSNTIRGKNPHMIVYNQYVHTTKLTKEYCRNTLRIFYHRCISLMRWVNIWISIWLIIKNQTKRILYSLKSNICNCLSPSGSISQKYETRCYLNLRIGVKYHNIVLRELILNIDDEDIWNHLNIDDKTFVSH